MRDGVVVMLMGLLLPGGLLAQAGYEEGREGTFVDTRDGESYAWVRIGSQVWMAGNLRFATSTGSTTPPATIPFRSHAPTPLQITECQGMARTRRSNQKISSPS